MPHPIKSDQIVMYSTNWCPDCKRIKILLNNQNIPYLEIDIDKDASASEFVKSFNNGKRIIPTIFFPDGTTMVEPSNQLMIEKLRLIRTN